MKKRILNNVVCIALILLPGIVLFGQPQFTIAPSPSSALVIAPIAQGDPATAALFASGRENLQPVSLLLSNRGSQAIVGIVVLTTVTDQSGKQRTSRDVRDSFLSGGHVPVLNPGSSLLVIPTGIWIKPGDVAGLASDPGRTRQLQHAANWIPTASSRVTVNVDAIVLASGEVDGPDTTNFMGELGDRKRAAESVIAAINGPSPNAALSQLAAGPPMRQGDRFVQWQRLYAGDYLKASTTGGGAAVLGAMQVDLAIPQLFRGIAPNSN